MTQPPQHLLPQPQLKTFFSLLQIAMQPTVLKSLYLVDEKKRDEH